MELIIKFAVAIAAAAGYASANVFASFCDDTGCSVNCGIGVDVTNPGCLTEVNRHSIHFSGVNYANINLVFSPDQACSCQVECDENLLHGMPPIYEGPNCLDLTGHAFAESFRFQDNACDPDNC